MEEQVGLYMYSVQALSGGYRGGGGAVPWGVPAMFEGAPPFYHATPP